MKVLLLVTIAAVAVFARRGSRFDGPTKYVHDDYDCAQCTARGYDGYVWCLRRSNENVPEYDDVKCIPDHKIRKRSHIPPCGQRKHDIRVTDCNKRPDYESYMCPECDFMGEAGYAWCERYENGYRKTSCLPKHHFDGWNKPCGTVEHDVLKNDIKFCPRVDKYAEVEHVDKFISNFFDQASDVLAGKTKAAVDFPYLEIISRCNDGHDYDGLYYFFPQLNAWQSRKKDTLSVREATIDGKTVPVWVILENNDPEKQRAYTDVFHGDLPHPFGIWKTMCGGELKDIEWNVKANIQANQDYDPYLIRFPGQTGKSRISSAIAVGGAAATSTTPFGMYAFFALGAALVGYGLGKYGLLSK